MSDPTSPSHESARLAALAEYDIIDTPPEVPFDDLAVLACQLLSAPEAVVSFVDADRIWHKARTGTDPRERPRKGSFCDRAIQQDGVFEIPDTLADESFSSHSGIQGKSPIRFYAAAPLATPEGLKIGALAVLDHAPRRLTASQREALLALARQVVALLELRRALANLSRNYRQLHLLVEMNRMLQLCSSCESAYDVVASFGTQLFPDDAGQIYVRGRTVGEMESVAAWGSSPATREIFTVKDCWALRRGQPHSVVAALGGGLVCNHMASTPLDYCFCVPLSAQGENLGVLSLFARRSASPRPGRSSFLEESKKSLAVAMAQSIALAVGNLRLRETLESQSVRDPLTGLFNRRYLEESLDRELSRAARHQRTLGLIMIDLDNFKNYNDRFGHFAGDELLRSLADLLRTGIRSGDFACRYGGDEFAIILPGASLQIAQSRAEDLRLSIKRLEAVFEQQGIEPITLSTGVAAFPDHGSTAFELLRLADVALYQAKAQGRDRAVIALSPSSSA